MPRKPTSIRKTGSIIDALFEADPSDDGLYGITVGQVVDTVDPHQMGRLKIRCPAFGDIADKPIEQIPWAIYCAPFAGSTQVLRRGPEDTQTADNNRVGGASVAYGMWGIPKPGANVFVFCIDNDPDYRVWFGCSYGDNLAHTLPHGRHKINHEGNKIDGPLSSGETHIEPLYSHQGRAFEGGGKVSQGKGRNSFEYVTRGADYSASGLSNINVPALGVPSDISDDFLTKLPDTAQFVTVSSGDFGDVTAAATQGYGRQRRSDADDASVSTFQNESQVFSWTTPGFHGISMDDRPENCRIRIRTTKGHQIILDDTNERIYISTAQGKSWMELDEKGNLDIFAERRISIHAQKDINFTTDEMFRVTAKKGIHFETPDEYRLHAGKDINIITDKNYRQVSKEETFLESIKDFNVFSSAQLLALSKESMHLKTLDQFRATSSSSMHHRAGGNSLHTALKIHLNGPAANQAIGASQCSCVLAFWTNRVPEHEPWSRQVMEDWDKNLSHSTLEHQYNSTLVNQFDSKDNLQRGSFWRR